MLCDYVVSIFFLDCRLLSGVNNHRKTGLLKKHILPTTYRDSNHATMEGFLESAQDKLVFPYTCLLTVMFTTKSQNGNKPNMFELLLSCNML